MTPKALEAFALSLPGATLSVQWGDDHVYKVGGKMFAVLGPGVTRGASMSFKCSELSFELLTGRRGIIPAPYLARAKWVCLETLSALDDDELKARLKEAHRLIFEKLTRKARAEIAAAAPDAPATPSKPAKKAAKKAKRA